jgi:outer membrane protein
MNAASLSTPRCPARAVVVFAAACSTAFVAFAAETPTPAAQAALTLQQCRQLALANNLVLRAQREALIASGHLLRAEYGAFEPELVTSAEREGNERENTIEQQISQGTAFFNENNNLFALGVEGVALTGARYRVGWSERDLNNNLRLRATDPFRRQFQGFLGLTLTQPLLKDFGLNATLARLRLAREDEALARQDYRRQMMLVLGATETAYWDLYVAQERSRLRGESVSVAKKLLAGNRDRVREGKMAEIELVEAEAGLAQRRSLASEADQRLVDAAGRLRTLFAEPVDGANWLIVAADALPSAASTPPIEEAITAAFEQHPEYLARKHRVEQERVRVAYARNQRWPQIDLKASYGKNALGDNFYGAWNDIEYGRNDSWSLGLEVRVPMLSGIRRANELGAADAKRREALLQLKAAEIEIANNLFAAQRKVEGLRDVATNYDEVVQAGRRLLDNEQSRLGEGRSESRRLLEVETQYADAQVAALESRGEFEKARIEFELSAGRILQTRGIDLPADVPRADPLPNLGRMRENRE